MSALVSEGRPSPVARITYLLSAALFLTFALVQPFANHIDPALLAMGAVIALLIVPALYRFALFPRELIEAAVFLPMLMVSIAVGVLNGNDIGNVVRGVVPYGIYIIVFASFLVLSDRRKERLLRWFILAAVFVCFKTFVLAAVNGVGPADFIRGVRATYFDINSGLPIALAAVPLAFATIRRWPWRVLIVAILTLQIVIGLSKALMGLTAIFYIAYFFRIGLIGSSRQAGLFVDLGKILAFGLALIVLIATFDENPLTQRFVLMFTDTQIELSGRTNEYRSVIKAIEDHPLLGRGQGYVFKHQIASSTDTNPVYEERRYTHSIVFYHWGVMGLLGMPFALLLFHGPFFLLAGHMIRDALIRKRWSTDDSRSGIQPHNTMLETSRGTSRLSFALLLSGFGLFAFNLVSASFKNPQSLIILALVNAMTFAVLSARRVHLQRRRHA